MKVSKEESLREPVEKFFAEKNYTVYHEVKLLARKIDVVAKRKSQIVAIELKLHDWARALQQAYLNLHVSDYSYIALPESLCQHLSPKIYPLAAENGIGLMSVDGMAKEIMTGRHSTMIIPHLRRTFLGQIAASQPDPR